MMGGGPTAGSLTEPKILPKNAPTEEMTAVAAAPFTSMGTEEASRI